MLEHVLFCVSFPVFCCSCCCLCFLGVAVLSYPGPSTQQYLKIHIRPPAIGSVIMVNGDSSHIFSLPLTPPPPPALPLTHQPLFTSFGYNMPTCSTIGFEPASSCSEEPQKDTGINTHTLTSAEKQHTHLSIMNISFHKLTIFNLRNLNCFVFSIVFNLSTFLCQIKQIHPSGIFTINTIKILGSTLSICIGTT